MEHPVKITIIATIYPSAFASSALEDKPERYLSAAAETAARRVFKWFDPRHVLTIDTTAEFRGQQAKGRIQG